MRGVRAEDLVKLVTDKSFLWFLNRGTGIVLVALLTVSVALGVMATVRTTSRLWPRFVTQAVHRNIALVTAALIVAHATTAIMDTYVDIRWYDAFIPVGAKYEPLWLGVGTLASDLVLVTIITSLLRHRMGHRSWRALHLATYAAWALGIAHGLGIGTDSSTVWSTSVTVTSVGVVAAAAVVRLATQAHERSLAT